MIKEANINLEYILNQIEYGVAMIDRKSMKVIKINQAAKKMFALPEIDDNFNVVSYIQSKFRINVGNNKYFYFEGESSDTCNRTFEVYTKFIDASLAGEADMIVAIIREVTDIKAQESKRRNFLQVISYKLIAQITEVKSILSLLKGESFTTEQEQALKELDERFRKIDRLTKALLSFTVSLR